LGLAKGGGRPQVADQKTAYGFVYAHEYRNGIRYRVQRESDHLPTIVEGVGRAKIFAQRAEVEDLTIPPQDSVACW